MVEAEGSSRRQLGEAGGWDVAGSKAPLTFCSVSWRFPSVPSLRPLLICAGSSGFQFFVRRTPGLQQ